MKLPRIWLAIFLVALIFPLRLNAQEKRVVYAESVLDIRRTINMLAADFWAPYDDVTLTLIRVRNALNYVQRYRPEYQQTFPGRYQWLQKLVEADALAILVRMPNHQGDVAVYIPEPINIDDPDILNGLVIQFPASESGEASTTAGDISQQKTSTGGKKPASKEGTEDTTPLENGRHPIFNLSQSEDDPKAFDTFPIGTTWRIRAPKVAPEKDVLEKVASLAPAKAHTRAETSATNASPTTPSPTPASSYCLSSTSALQVVNAYAIQYGLTPEAVRAKVVKVADARSYIERHAPHYLAEHSKVDAWFKRLISLDALALQIRAPELNIDSFYIPEPLEADVPFVHDGLLVHLNDRAKHTQDNCLGYEVGAPACVRVSGNTTCEPCPTDPEHPLFKIFIAPEYRVGFDASALGKTWRIR